MRLLTVALLSVLALATLFGFLGRLWWVFDLAASFRFQYILVLVTIAAAAGLWRRFDVLGVALVLALINGTAVAVALWGDRPVPDPAKQTVTVLSFNVLVSNERSRDVIDYVAASGADVVFLHESSIDWEDVLVRSDLPYRMVPARLPGDRFGSVALVRPDLSAGTVRFGDRAGVVVDVTLEGRPLQVIGVHPRSPISSRAARSRADTLDAVGRFVAATRTPSVVVGDLNSTPWSYPFRHLLRTAGLVDSERGYGWQPSWPTPLPGVLRIPIDHALVSPGIAVVDRTLGRSLGSDHRPLVVELQWATTVAP